MWQNLDFSGWNITFQIENAEFRLVEAKRTLFYENFPNHMHSFFELHYICGGEGTLILPDAMYPLSEGVLYLIPPKLFHEQRTYWQNLMEEYTFSFDVKKVKTDSAFDLYGKFSRQDFWIGEGDYLIKDSFGLLEEEAKKRDIGFSYIIRSVLEQMIIRFLRNIPQKQPVVQKNGTTPYERRKFIIDETMIYQYKDITLDKLAEYLNLSSRQTARILEEEYGMSFSKLRRQSRLHAAASLLIGTKLTVDEVAELVGYENEIYFGKQFKELYGVTPSVYRKT